MKASTGSLGKLLTPELLLLSPQAESKHEEDAYNAKTEGAESLAFLSSVDIPK